MKYKTMYGIHELRMWIGTAITGIAAIGAITAAHPELVEKTKEKVRHVKEKFKKPKLKIVVSDPKDEP